MPLNSTHKALVRENLRGNGSSYEPRKKRRRTVKTPSPESSGPIDVDSQSTDDFEDIDLEDVDLVLVATDERVSVGSTPANKPELPPKDPRFAHFDSSDDSGSGSEYNSDDFDDLEDVDLDPDASASKRTKRGDETLTFSIKTGDQEKSEAKKKRTFTPIPKHERKARKIVHKAALFLMVSHGAIRNRWCSDERMLSQIRKVVSQEIVDLFDQDNADVLDFVKSKRFVDGLRKLSSIFSRKFKVTSPGLQRQDWGSSEVSLGKKDKKVTFADFQKSVKRFQGSRDVGAQAFVALLRSINVHARLVFSVQVPDFRSVRPVKGSEADEKNGNAKAEAESDKPKSEFDPVFIPNARQAILSGVRAKKQREKADKTQQTKPRNSKFPVFWIEVWNKYSKKWITVDPIVFNVVEVVPMRRKCKFDAPGADETHQTWYVIAYDQYGTVKDVTRRYTQFYNAKTVKRRIGSCSEKEQHWYDHMLQAVSRQKSKITFAEAMELKEFHDRHICEGTPNNMADFKSHPVYALESQLRQDEVIYPNDESSKCGTFRSSNKSNVTSIYKRSCVYRLRTPKAWHMNGRVLKVGAQPLKIKQIQAQFADDGDVDDGQARLYAEFQTELYKPAPIVDGKIVKNAYGNVEIFRPHMVPENGFLVPVTAEVSMKMLENAAKWILNIDYARAIVAFEFGKAQKKSRVPTAREGGILIDAQYKEAMLAVLAGLKDQQEQEKREAVELNALRSWNFFLKKLQIIKRLDRNHGKVVEDDWLEPRKAKKTRESTKSSIDDDEPEEGYYSEGSEFEESAGGEEEEEGGFIMGDNIGDNGESANGEFLTEGGFVADVSDAEDANVSTATEEEPFIAESGSRSADPNQDILSRHLRSRLRHARAGKGQKPSRPVTGETEAVTVSDNSSSDNESGKELSGEDKGSDENDGNKENHEDESIEEIGGGFLPESTQDEEIELGIEYSD